MTTTTITIPNIEVELTVEQLITAVWGTEGADKTMLKQLVYRLRGKLETDTPRLPLIETIPGIGYSLRLP